MSKKINLSDVDINESIDGSLFRYAIIVSDWNREITDRLLNGAYNSLIEHGAKQEHILVKHVPGSFELPQLAQVIAKKQLFEKQFNEAISSDPAKKEKYGNIFPQLQKVYAEYKILNKQVDYYSECLIAIDAFYYARTYIALNNELKKKQKGIANTYDKTLEEYKKLGFFKNYNKPTDVKICEAMLA